MIDLTGSRAKLAAAMAERGGNAYVLTVTADGRPHATHATVRWEGDRLAADLGTQTALNAQARPLVSLLFPVRTPGDYSLIVDGSAAVDPASKRMLLTVDRAVLHRPGPPPDPTSSCGADCVPLLAGHAHPAAGPS